MKPDSLRMLFGFIILIALSALAALIGLGHVEEKTSFGLMAILTSLSTLAGSFAQWAFSHKTAEKKQEETNDESKSQTAVSTHGT